MKKHVHKFQITEDKNFVLSKKDQKKYNEILEKYHKELMEKIKKNESNTSPPPRCFFNEILVRKFMCECGKVKWVKEK